MKRDSRREPMPMGERNIAYTASDGYRARGIVLLDEKGNQHANSRTAFGEQLVAQLHPVIQQSFEYTVSNTDLTENTLEAGGTVTHGSGMAIAGTSTTTASTAWMESFRHAKYRAGLGGLMRFTGLYTEGVAATEQMIGLMDGRGSSASFLNGYAIGYVGTEFGVHRWQNDVLTTINLSACDDPLNGTGPSGMVLDPTKLNVFEIRFQYLGSGKIDYAVEDDRTGNFIVFHSVLYANKETTPSVHNPNFHCSLWVDNKGTTSNLVIKTGSWAFFNEGITTFIEMQQPQNSSGLREKTGVTSEVAIFTIRNKALYNSKINFIELFLENITAQIEASAANNLGSVRLVRDATLGGTPSYADINATNSVVDIDVAGTTVTGGKELLVIPLAGKNDSKNQNVTDFRIMLKHGQTLTIAGKSANSATIDAALLWRELF